MALFLRTNRRPWYDDYNQPMRLFDQHFGAGVWDDDLLTPIPPMSIFGLTSRPRHFHNRQESGLSEVKCDKDKFQVNLDVQQFKPEELNVKTVDNYIVIEGKHEEKEDEHGYVSRHFVRRYQLPENSKAENVHCNLSSDGVLQIQVAREVKELPANERSVPIAQTGEPALPQRKIQQAPPTTDGNAGTGDVQMK